MGSFKECIEFLEDASRTNPNGIRADYVLGLIYSLPYSGILGPDLAEKHFRKVLAREPDHPGALNSLAIAQIKQRDFNAAVVNLSRAAEVSESCQEVSQNLGRFIFLVQSGRVPASNTVVNVASNTSRSPGVVASTPRTRATSTSLTPMWTSVPASAAIGIMFACGANNTTSAITSTPEKMHDMRVTAPDS